MHYVLVEDGRVISTINYEPSVPDTIEVYPIADEAYECLTAKTHYFCIVEKKIVEVPKEVKDQQLTILSKKNGRAYLATTDWMVLRHIRELALKLPTSLSEEEYITLEEKRQTAAKAIVN